MVHQGDRVYSCQSPTIRSVSMLVRILLLAQCQSPWLPECSHTPLIPPLPSPPLLFPPYRPDEYPFTPVSSLPKPILPPVDYPSLLQAHEINVNQQILRFYKDDIVPSITRRFGKVRFFFFFGGGVFVLRVRRNDGRCGGVGLWERWGHCLRLDASRPMIAKGAARANGELTEPISPFSRGAGRG